MFLDKNLDHIGSNKCHEGVFMITRKELIRMRNMTFDEIDPDDAIDLDDLDVDVTLSKQEKILNILNSGKNPYFCKSQGYLIKVGFEPNGVSAEEALESLVKMKW